DPSQLTPELRQARYENMMRRPEHLSNMVKCLQASPTHAKADLTPRLGEIAHETLVIWGRDDRFNPMDYGLKLLWGLRRAQFHVFGQCGHWAQWEHADAFNQMSIDFLKR